MLGFGTRSGLGFFLTPMSQANGWGRDVFSLALAIQMLLWGAAQPFAGAIADRFGPVLVLSVGAILYALGPRRHGLYGHARHAAVHRRRAGRLRARGLVVHGGDRRIRQADAAAWRTFAFGAGTAAGSFGQFLFSPLAVALIGSSAGSRRW